MKTHALSANVDIVFGICGTEVRWQGAVEVLFKRIDMGAKELWFYRTTTRDIPDDMETEITGAGWTAKYIDVPDSRLSV